MSLESDIQKTASTVIEDLHNGSKTGVFNEIEKFWKDHHSDKEFSGELKSIVSLAESEATDPALKKILDGFSINVNADNTVGMTFAGSNTTATIDQSGVMVLSAKDNPAKPQDPPRSPKDEAKSIETLIDSGYDENKDKIAAEVAKFSAAGGDLSQVKKILDKDGYLVDAHTIDPIDFPERALPKIEPPVLPTDSTDPVKNLENAIKNALDDPYAWDQPGATKYLNGLKTIMFNYNQNGGSMGDLKTLMDKASTDLKAEGIDASFLFSDDLQTQGSLYMKNKNETHLMIISLSVDALDVQVKQDLRP